MLHLDDNFLADVGLAAMPESQRPAFLQHVYETLETRVGIALSDGLSDTQISEFGAIIDRDQQLIAEWLELHAPDFGADPLYHRMQETLAQRQPSAVLCEYAATKWLEVNRPDYRTVTAAVFDALSAEIRAGASRILTAPRRAVGESLGYDQR